MTVATPDLLLLRLDTLELDITKVRAAVERAEKRSEYLLQARDHLAPHKKLLNALRDRLRALERAMEEEPQIAKLIGETSFELDTNLLKAPELVDTVIQAFNDTTACLRKAMATTVSLEDDRSRTLEASLFRRCDELNGDLKRLREEVQGSGLKDRRGQWLTYQQILDQVARPLFAEYVDFLGGLTVRDTGLDDQVCEMTDALLTRFKGVTHRSLPLPARQSALGNALDSVVLLGFPEWSIWGIPLVGHEVGLAYAKDRNDQNLVSLVQRFVTKPPAHEAAVGDDQTTAHPPQRTEEYVHQLLADAFATYTLGFSYACAAVLLRLSPRHDEPVQSDRPRDVDRARVIMTTLQTEGSTAPAAGGSFSDGLGDLQRIWESAARAHAAPASADVTAQDASGSSATDDWLDDLACQAVEHFRGLKTIRPYDNARWRASDIWFEALRSDKAGPGWAPADDAVSDALTAAWRLRLLPGAKPAVLAAEVKKRWSDSWKGA